MTLKPLADRVILKAMEAQETTKGGIILTASAKEKPEMAEVVAVGPGGVVDGEVLREQRYHIRLSDKKVNFFYPQGLSYQPRMEEAN